MSNGSQRIQSIMMVILVARTLNDRVKHLTVMALIEFIHTITFLNNYVMNESDICCGQPTSNATFGDAVSV